MEESMTRPILVDIVGIVFPIVIGAVLFVAGRFARRWPRSIRVGALTLAVGVVALGVMTLARLIPIEANRFVSKAGGSTVLLSYTAFFLLGVVWAVPGRSLSTSFLSTLAAVAGTLLVIEVAGPLWW